MRQLTLAVALALACTSAAVPPVSPTAAPTTAPTGTPSPEPAARVSPLIEGALALFDAHIHYSEPAWSLYTPEQALDRLARSGVRRAIVSSSPDDGTLRLYDLAPDVVVPFLRPYRGAVGPGSWARDGTTVAYMRARYRPGVHRGIGEVHLAAGESELPVVRQIIELAVAEKLWLQIHTDAWGIDEVMRGPASGTRVLWAHAGQTATPDEIGRLVARYPGMWVELAGRSDIGSGGTIAPAWRELFVRYPDRFLIGSDTWINPQWERLPEIEAENQRWLAQLPADVARRIASGNAEALFPPPR